MSQNPKERFVKEPAQAAEKLTPREWQERTGIMILDPDGWRGKDYRDFSDPIDEAEWNRRMTISTVLSKEPFPR